MSVRERAFAQLGHVFTLELLTSWQIRDSLHLAILYTSRVRIVEVAELAKLSTHTQSYYS